jgi:high-affinity iron transporter
VNGLVSAFFVVWRESFEALLIVFLMWTALKKQEVWTQTRSFVFSGVLIGALSSVVFAFLIIKAGSLLEGSAAQFAQAILPILAAGLLVHMVIWMSGHAREIAANIRVATASLDSTGLRWSCFSIVAYAVAREGFETVVYLYSMSVNPANGTLSAFQYLVVTIVGLAAASALLMAVSRGLQFLQLKTFFKVTNFFLLGTGAALLVSGVNKLIELELLPAISDPAWNMSNVIDGNGQLGRVLAVLVGYTPTPSLMLVICYVGFWIAALWMLSKSTRVRAA